LHLRGFLVLEDIGCFSAAFTKKISLINIKYQSLMYLFFMMVPT
jgi:hypothetical protein